MPRPRIALALGSGGWKGMAHIGVLRALAEAEIRPAVYAGSSAGALIAAAAAHDISLVELEALAERLLRDPLFRVDVAGLLKRGRRAQSLYRSAPLRRLCAELFGDTTFRDLRTRLVVSTVDVEHATLLCWGLPSLPDAPVADAVYASCAIPGLLPPGRVRGRPCMDGAVLDPLALGAVTPLADLVIAVVLDGPSPVARAPTFGAAHALWWHAQAIVMRHLADHTLARWDGPPLMVLRLSLSGVDPVRACEPGPLIQAGYEAARRALAEWDGGAPAAGGIGEGTPVM
jgi:NTE family protein